jgi:hypothetical protein
MTSGRYRTIHYVLDILQGAGLALACGINPFLPVLLAGALASADVGIDFDHTPFAFLEDGWFLLAVTVAFVASVLMRARFETSAARAALGGIGIGFGALIAAGCVADRSHVWWPGLVAGVACAAIAGAATNQLVARTRRRLDSQAAAALGVYTAGVSLVEGALTVLVPPLTILALAFFGWLAVAGRRREGEKYAGLRILR